MRQRPDDMYLRADDQPPAPIHAVRGPAQPGRPASNKNRPLRECSSSEVDVRCIQCLQRKHDSRSERYVRTELGPANPGPGSPLVQGRRTSRLLRNIRYRPLKQPKEEVSQRLQSARQKQLMLVFTRKESVRR